jgi:hypothetical protein
MFTLITRPAFHAVMIEQRVTLIDALPAPYFEQQHLPMP